MKAKEVNMREFTYRTPRYTIDLPVCLKVQDSVISGQCREIGVGGMRVQFTQPVPPKTCGKLSIRYKDIAVDLSVRITHSQSGLDGLKFQFESYADRNAVRCLIAYFSDSSDKNRPVLVR